MLLRLRISNYALVEDLQLEFGPGLNVITGETGAGKSILVDAISLAAGGRPKPDKTAKKSTEIELEFSGSNNSPGDDLTIKLRREIKPGGKTQAFIDGKNCTINSLREEASLLVDLTAQREGATLLDTTSHLHHLDRLAGLETQSLSLASSFHTWESLIARQSSLDSKIQRLRETEELAKFQLEEIEKFSPSISENRDLDAEIRLLEGAESVITGLTQAIDILDQGEDAITDRLSLITGTLKNLSDIDPALKESNEWIENALVLIKDTSRDLISRRDSVQLDPERLEELRDRRGHLSRLIRKYGGSMEALMETLESLRNRESDITQIIEERKELSKKIRSHLESWEKQLVKISESRKQAAPGIAKNMEILLKKVGVEHPEFVVAWKEEEGQLIEFPKSGEHRVGPENGWDQVEFCISFNPGYPVKPLQHVASGGELSRVMLLLKGMSPPEKMPPCLIFDEIDTGISGKTARQVGLRLKELAKERQVLLVTHLPQIASLADRHLVIEKKQETSSTTVITRSVSIGSDEQVEEIARLTGGETVTEAARQGAKELIGNSR